MIDLSDEPIKQNIETCNSNNTTCSIEMMYLFVSGYFPNHPILDEPVQK